MRRDRRQPKTRALLLRSSPAALLERLEDPFLVLGGHADAGVGHRDHKFGALAVGADADAAAVGGELHGVGEQVEDHLLESELVGVDRPDVGRYLHRDGDGVQ